MNTVASPELQRPAIHLLSPLDVVRRARNIYVAKAAAILVKGLPEQKFNKTLPDYEIEYAICVEQTDDGKAMDFLFKRGANKIALHVYHENEGTLTACRYSVGEDNSIDGPIQWYRNTDQPEHHSLAGGVLLRDLRQASSVLATEQYGR